MGNKKIIPPKRFVGLHAHSTFSIGDGIGRPQDHIDFAIKNEMDALALTDHGNMNGFSHQYNYWQQLKKKGVDFKALPGVEAYFVPSLKEWRELYDKERARKEEEKLAKKRAALQKKSKKSLIGDPDASTKEDLAEIGITKEIIDEETKGDSGVENEEESKKNRWKNPLFQRNHLVLLPKNDIGLKTLFKCISLSFKEGFYRYPRIDLEMLRKYSNGNIVALSACIAGTASKIVFDNQDPEQGFEDWQPNDYNFAKIQKELGAEAALFQEALGEENYFWELQFNKLGAQHLVNKHLIEASKRFNVPLVATCDSHYSEPEHWKEREIYKAMSMLQLMKKDPTEVAEALPNSVDDLKCQLYPKNAEQMWETYKQTTEQYDFYDDETIKNAIHMSYDIAHDMIDEVSMDTSVKLPALSKIVSKDKISELEKALESGQTEEDCSFAQLKREVIIGAKWRGIENKSEYIERLKTEMGVIKKLKFSKYFLTYTQIMKLVENHMITGPGRGSAGASLVAYVLNITQIDPVRYGLVFERFLTQYKKCLDPELFAMTKNGPQKIKDLQANTLILTGENRWEPVQYKEEDLHHELIEIETEDGQVITCSPNHSWIIMRNNEKIEIKAKDLLDTDELLELK